MYKRMKAIKIGLTITHCVANKPYDEACRSFNRLKSAYAAKVAAGQFSEDNYQRLFIDHDVDYYIELFEKKA